MTTHLLHYLSISQGNTPEWQSAHGLFVANAANLLKATKNTLRASKSALTFPDNYFPDESLPQCVRDPLQSDATICVPPRIFEPHYHNLEDASASTMDYHSPSPNTDLSPHSSATATSSQPPLSKQHMADICKCLYPLRAKWKTIGTFLCVEHNTLAAIKTDSEDSAEMLTELIAEWLKSHKPPPTGQALAEAVQYISPDKAEEIRQLFCSVTY